MARRRTLLISLLGLLVMPGCRSMTASPAARAGTGDVAFRLLWKTADDLDLHVVDPTGEYLGWSLRHSASGGRLDIDCNGSPLEACERPIENVFWPDGAAPEGEYLVWAVLQRPETASPVPYRFRVLQGQQVVWRARGELAGECAFGGPWAVQFVRGAVPRVENVSPAEVVAALRDRDLAGCPAPGVPGKRDFSPTLR